MEIKCKGARFPYYHTILTEYGVLTISYLLFLLQSPIQNQVKGFYTWNLTIKRAPLSFFDLSIRMLPLCASTICLQI